MILTIGFSATLSASPIEKFTLKNGLDVLLLEDHKAPVVTFQVWYAVGSRNEQAGKTGLSHMTEHMMFKGTKKVPKGEFSKIVARNGGTENAFTGKDYTAYFENFSSDRIDLSLRLESDRMVNLLMDPKEFLLERDVVAEERRMRTDDDPNAVVVEGLYAQAFMEHPYHSPVIGWMNDIQNYSRDDAYRHYKTYYIPNNARIVVVGDFDAAALRKKIRRAFGSIPRGPEPPKVTGAEPPQRGERRFLIKKEAQLPFVFAGYRAPNFKSPDAYALDVLANILSSGKSSRIYKSIVYEKKIALDAGGFYDPGDADPDLFYIYGVVKPGHTADEVERALIGEIEKIQKDLVAKEELEKAKNQVEASYIYGQDSNFNRAMQIGLYETIGAGAEYYLQYADNIRKVTAEDVRRVARTYLVQDARTVGILVPQPPEETGKERSP
jgi:zinc protease